MNIENDVRLIGNLGNDPEVKYTQGGMAITRVSLATTSKRKDRDGNQVEETQWHRVVFFGKLAEIAGEYLRKGSKIAVAGMIRYGKYEKDGVTHYTTDIACDQMKMLDARPADGERTQRQAPQRQQQAPQRQAPPMDDFADDDIPF
ncbi:single-stranded DNA-binding protein [Xanthomonas phage MET23-P3]|nr:single-stranded DNA-binding protein [Xanthomonas phage MET23-P3]